MCFKIVLSILSINLLSQNEVHCIPLQLFQVLTSKDSVTGHEDVTETNERNAKFKPFTTNDKMLIGDPFSFGNFGEEDIESEILKTDKNVGNNKIANRDFQPSKRATSEHSSSPDKVVGKEVLASEEGPEGQSRASIPFLQKEESDSSSGGSSGGLSGVPGLSQIPGASSALSGASGADSSTPTLVTGGFSFIIMPMPGLTMSNIGSALQTGQQMSQLVPGMPSLPG